MIFLKSVFVYKRKPGTVIIMSNDFLFWTTMAKIRKTYCGLTITPVRRIKAYITLYVMYTYIHTGRCSPAITVPIQQLIGILCYMYYYQTQIHLFDQMITFTYFD